MKLLIETDKTEQHQEGVDAILNLIGYPEALVTDHSQIEDFGDEAIEDLNSFLDCKRGDMIWELARRVEIEDTE